MKKVILFSVIALLISSFHTIGSGSSDSAALNVDREQEQLKWCFLYSNLFGFNITYINNPRLYRVAGEWLGTPYKYGGCSKNGIDCSGFVSTLIQNSYNKQVNGSARDIYNMCKPISRQELREGDLVFFRIKKNRISHVGIYLGENKFVHASLKKGVTVSDMDDPYYNKYFFKGGRIYS